MQKQQSHSTILPTEEEQSKYPYTPPLIMILPGMVINNAAGQGFDGGVGLSGTGS